MKKEIQKAKYEYTCDFTGKDLDKLDGMDPSSIHLCVMSRNKEKVAVDLAASDEGISIKAAKKSVNLDYYRDYEIEYLDLDLAPEIAFEVFQFLKRKYPKVISKFEIEDRYFTGEN